MSRQPVLTENAPKPLPGIYSQAIVANGFVYCSGQIPTNPATGKLAEGGIQEHTHQCIKNLGEVLKAAGSSLEKCVEVNVFLDDMSNFQGMNEVYTQYFGDVKPARTFVPWRCTFPKFNEDRCVAVKTLPLNVDVEIKCVAIQ